MIRGAIYLQKAKMPWFSNLQNQLNPIFSRGSVYQSLSRATQSQSKTVLRIHNNYLEYLDTNSSAWHRLFGSKPLAKRIKPYVGNFVLTGRKTETQVRLILKALAKPLPTMVSRLKDQDIPVIAPNEQELHMPASWNDLYSQLVSEQSFFSKSSAANWSLTGAVLSALATATGILSFAVNSVPESESLFEALKSVSHMPFAFVIAVFGLFSGGYIGHNLGNYSYCAKTLICKGPTWLIKRAKMELHLRQLFKQSNPSS